MGIALATRSTHRFVRLIGVVLPLAMFVATVVTANHYLADGLVGAVVAFAGLTVAWRLRDRTRVMEIRSRS